MSSCVLRAAEGHLAVQSPPSPPPAAAAVSAPAAATTAATIPAAKVRTEADEETSYLAHIEASSGSNPVDLLREWKVVAASRGSLGADAMVLATVNNAMEVSARAVMLRRIDGDGLVFMTDSRSRKSADLVDHPHASVVFNWHYRLGQRVVSRQVRAGGKVIRLPDDAFGDLYSREPFYCRVRAHLCHQGAKVDWSAHAARHDELLAEYKAGSTSIDERPDHVVAYSLRPDWLEFYHALDDCIGDRVLFKRNGGASSWTMDHIAA